MSRRRRRIVRVIGPGSSLGGVQGGSGAMGDQLLMEDGGHLRYEDMDLVELGADEVASVVAYTRLGLMGVAATNYGS